MWYDVFRGSKRGDNMPIFLVALAVMLGAAVAGCIGTLWGSLFVFAIVIGIFYGTLALGRYPKSEPFSTSVEVTRIATDLPEYSAEEKV